MPSGRPASLAVPAPIVTVKRVAKGSGEAGSGVKIRIVVPDHRYVAANRRRDRDPRRSVVRWHSPERDHRLREDDPNLVRLVTAGPSSARGAASSTRSVADWLATPETESRQHERWPRRGRARGDACRSSGAASVPSAGVAARGGTGAQVNVLFTRFAGPAHRNRHGATGGGSQVSSPSFPRRAGL